MPKECIGEEINKDLIEQLSGLLNKFVSANKQKRENISDMNQVFDTGLKEESGEVVYLFKDKQETFDLYMELLNILAFEKKKSSEVYEIRGLVIESKETGVPNIDGTLYITASAAKHLATNSKKYKDLLNITFPDEVYQIYHENFLTGETYKAPDVRRMDETEEEYETRLEEHYKLHGIKKEEDGNYRKPYPHEYFRYGLEKSEIKKTDTPSAAYAYRKAENVIDKKHTKHGGKGTKPGEKRKVVGTNKTLGQKVGAALTTVRGVMGSKETGKKILKGALVLGAGGAALTKFGLAATGLFGVEIALAYFGIKYGIKYGKKGIAALKKKWNDWIRGPVIEEEDKGKDKEKAKDEDKDKEKDKDKKKEETPIVTEEVKEVLDEISPDAKEVRDLESRIAIINNAIAQKTIELDNAPDDKKVAIEAQIQQYNDQLEQLRNLERQYLINIYNIIHQYAKGKEVSTGGPSK